MLEKLVPAVDVFLSQNRVIKVGLGLNVANSVEHQNSVLPMFTNSIGIMFRI